MQFAGRELGDPIVVVKDLEWRESMAKVFLKVDLAWPSFLKSIQEAKVDPLEKFHRCMTVRS